MRIKFNIALLFLLGLTIANAQTKKATTKTTAVVAKPQLTTSGPAAPAISTKEGIFAEIETAKGKILIKLEYQKTPVTVANFIALAEGTNTQVADKYKGRKFYDGLKFHRVIKDFMIQGGDPDGNGQGGPGYAFKDEFTDAKFDKAGILAMANSGPKTNGSQFFITHKDTPWLTGKHTIFGYVVTGQDVVNAIAQDDVMTKVTITRKGADANKFNASKVFSDYFAGKAEEERIQAEKDAAARAIAYEKVAKDFANATTTASGLKYIVLQEGTGAMPVATSNVNVQYTGSFLDGKVFDSSVQRGQPIDFGLNQVIPGWTEGVQLMKEGAKYKFFIPYNLAYGDRGAGGVIPPKADLIFEVELIKINN